MGRRIVNLPEITAVTSDDYLVAFNNADSTTYKISSANFASTSLNDNGVSFEKIQQIGGQTLLGNSNASTGDIEQITVGNGLTFDGTTLEATGGGGGGGASGEYMAYTVTQTAHGFIVGDVLRSSGTANQYAKAQADSEDNAEVVGMVTTVTDANTFILTTGGYVTTGVPSGTAGSVLFLSPSTAGALTATEPTTAGQVSKPVGIIIESSQKMLLYNLRGMVLTASGSGSTISVQESDGSPAVTGVTTLKVSNGTLTDNGDGSVTITTGGGGGGGGTPGGSDTQVQFNDSSSFGGDSGLTFNKTTDTLTAANLTLTNDLPLTEGGTGASTAGDARTNLGLVAGGGGDIWVEKAGDTMTGRLTLQNPATTSGIGVLFRNNGVYDVTVAAGQQLSMIDLQHKNSETVDTNSLFYGIKLTTDSDSIDTAAGFALFNNGKSDGLYIRVAGKSGATASQPTGLGMDFNRSGLNENSSVNTGYGIQIWDWSQTDSGGDEPTMLFIDKYNNHDTHHMLLKIKGNRNLMRAIVPGDGAYTGAEPLIDVQTAGGVQRMVITAHGDLAVGPDIPTLEIQSHARVGSLASGNQVTAYLTTSSLLGKLISEKHDFSNTGRNLAVCTQNSQQETARFTTGGLFSVGNTSPTLRVESSTTNGIVNSSNGVAAYFTSGSLIGKIISEKNDFTNTARALSIHTKNTQGESVRIDTSGNVGIGQTSPTAVLHLKAGTATANTAPLKLAAGTNLTSAEAGAMEYDGSSLFFSPSTTRLRTVLTDNSVPSNGQIPIGNGTNYTNATITGTSNQVTVTNGAGTITLSTPQSIGTASTPTFAQLTISNAPSNNTDAATKGYVDSVAQGLNAKNSCAVATTANITLSGEQTIDGVLTSTSRVLVKNQSTGSQNGIYVSGAGAWSRATDADTDAEVTTGMFTFITGGTTQANTGWVLTTTGTITVDTTALSFSQFSASASIVAGSGLTLTGSTIDVVGTSNRIDVAANSIDISTSYVGQASITTLGTITTGTWTGTTIAVANGGTGATTASNARTNLGLGTVATQDASNVTLTGGSITGITDLAIADGGTGASTAAGARTNLGLGTIATQDSTTVSITGGSVTGITDLAVADGGTGASDASTARTNLGLGSIATQASSNVTITGGAISGITDLAVADGGTGGSTATVGFNNLSPLTTQGDILYHNGTNNVRLAKGTANQMLRMNSGATAPEWAAARSIVELSSDVASTASASFQNITGLSFAVTSGTNYRFYAVIPYTASAITIGVRFSLTAPATTILSYNVRVAHPAATTGGAVTAGTDATFENWTTATDTGTHDTNGSVSTGNNVAFIEGFIRPSASGTVQLRFAPETATASGITIKAGATLEVW